mmetsp:Transcript_82126/g.237364  ORF Transcript_82126/g.237364 Transcript_82126/m.237364 type:complete len:254 (-) Transcript_82126:535-1296(-)
MARAEWHAAVAALGAGAAGDDRNSETSGFRSGRFGCDDHIRHAAIAGASVERHGANAVGAHLASIAGGSCFRHTASASRCAPRKQLRPSGAPPRRDSRRGRRQRGHPAGGRCRCARAGGGAGPILDGSRRPVGLRKSGGHGGGCSQQWESRRSGGRVGRPGAADLPRGPRGRLRRGGAALGPAVGRPAAERGQCERRQFAPCGGVVGPCSYGGAPAFEGTSAAHAVEESLRASSLRSLPWTRGGGPLVVERPR